MDAHEEPNEWRCEFCGAGPFTYDVGPGGWDEHWRSCEKSPRSLESRNPSHREMVAPLLNQAARDRQRMDDMGLVGHPQTFPADQMNRIVEVTTPLQAQLFCPHCGAQHIDQGEWAVRPHHKHLCAACGKLWRVEPYCVGVAPAATVDELVQAASMAVAMALPFGQFVPRVAEVLEGTIRGMCSRGLPQAKNETGRPDDEDEVQAIALALAELSLRRPGWLDYLRGVAGHYDAHLLFEQFRQSSAGAVPEAPDSPLVSRVEELTREVHRLRSKCARYAEYSGHQPGCKDFVVPRGRCDCGYLELLSDVNTNLVLPPPPDGSPQA